MVLAFLQIVYLSNAVLIVFCGVILLFLLKSMKIRDKLWIASIVSILLIVLTSIIQIVSYNNLWEEVRQKESLLDTLRTEYAKLKSESAAARVTYADTKNAIRMSRQEFDQLQKNIDDEFERTVAEIRSVYANISDEDLDRRANNAIRKARYNLKNTIFH